MVQRQDAEVDALPGASAPSYLYIHVADAALIHVEVDNFWTETSLHLDIHLVAGLHQLFGQVHVVCWKAVVSTEGQNTRQKTHQMVLKVMIHKSAVVHVTRTGTGTGTDQVQHTTLTILGLNCP